jgi:hypothetical protein
MFNTLTYLLPARAASLCITEEKEACWENVERTETRALQNAAAPTCRRLVVIGDKPYSRVMITKPSFEKWMNFLTCDKLCKESY